MTMDKIHEAVKSNDIDWLLELTKDVSPETSGAAIAEYERYYQHELAIARTLQDILAQTKLNRSKRKIPETGSYSYNLE